MIGTDNLDDLILQIIGKKPTHVSEISRNTRVFRTKIQYRLNRLQALGLAKKEKNGIKAEWSAVFNSEHNKSYFKVYKGNQIVQAYKHLLKLPAQSVILCVQGSVAAESEFRNVPHLFIKKVHRIFKKKGIIMKGLLNQKAIGAFNNLETSLIKSHIGRTQGIKTFSGDDFLSGGEIMSTGELLLLANPGTRSAIIIKEKEITKVVNDALQMLFDILDGTKSFDLNEFLRTRFKPL